MSLPEKTPEQPVALRQLNHLTGFRAVAAYLVLIAHSVDVAFSYSGVPILHQQVVWLAYLGMSLFFVLSGFVITYSYIQSYQQQSWLKATYQFAIARFARLFPLYALFMLSNLNYWPSPLFDADYFIHYLFLTQSWVNAQCITAQPTWSISTECFFYLAFAIWMLRPARQRSTRRMVFSSICTYLVLLAGVYAVYYYQATINDWFQVWPETAPCKAVQTTIWISYYSPYLRIAEFIMGAIAARFYMAYQGKPATAWASYRALWLSILAIGVVVYIIISNMMEWPTWHTLATEYPFLQFLTENFGYAPFLAYLCYASSRYNLFITRALANRRMVFFGTISYSVYLVQFWTYSAINGYRSVLESDIAYENSLWLVLYFMMITTFFAYGTYTLWEMPSRRWLKNALSLT